MLARSCITATHPYPRTRHFSRGPAGRRTARRTLRSGTRPARCRAARGSSDRAGGSGAVTCPAVRTGFAAHGGSRDHSRVAAAALRQAVRRPLGHDRIVVASATWPPRGAAVRCSCGAAWCAAGACSGRVPDAAPMPWARPVAAAVVGDQLLRDDQHRAHTAVRGGAQRDLEAVRLGEPADHGEAEAGGLTEVGRGRCRPAPAAQHALGPHPGLLAEARRRRPRSRRRCRTAPRPRSGARGSAAASSGWRCPGARPARGSAARRWCR